MAHQTRPGPPRGEDAPPARSPAQIEADIVRTRRQLAGNLDRIADRVNPRSVARRTRESVRGQVGEAAARPPTWAVAGASALLLVLLGAVVWRRRH